MARSPLSAASAKSYDKEEFDTYSIEELAPGSSSEEAESISALSEEGSASALSEVNELSPCPKAPVLSPSLRLKPVSKGAESKTQKRSV